MTFASDVRRLGRACAAADGVAARHLYEALELSHPALIQELIRLQLPVSA